MQEILLQCVPNSLNREHESKQMLEPQNRAWQKWQCIGCFNSGHAKVNKRGLHGSLLKCMFDMEFKILMAMNVNLEFTNVISSISRGFLRLLLRTKKNTIFFSILCSSAWPHFNHNRVKTCSHTSQRWVQFSKVAMAKFRVLQTVVFNDYQKMALRAFYFIEQVQDKSSCRTSEAQPFVAKCQVPVVFWTINHHLT